MWLINSSIGRKAVISITGITPIPFLTFHVSMNVIAFFSGGVYNMIYELLGANWYAVMATIALVALVICHIVCALILTAQNLRARDNECYAVTQRSSRVEWASQDVLVLGIIVLSDLLLHLYNFWYNMMFAEIFHIADPLGNPADGFSYTRGTFAQPLYVVLYVIWLVAIWFHLTYGFWSAVQTLGISNKIWFNRWRTIDEVYATLLILGFLIVILAFTFGCAPSLCCA